MNPKKILWKNITISYLNLNLNYSTKYVWVSYVFITLLIAFLYNKFFSEKYNSLFFKILNRKESNI